MKILLSLVIMVIAVSPSALCQSKGELPFTGSTPSSNVHFRKALARFGDGQFDEGDAMIQQLLKDDPECGVAYMFLPAETPLEEQEHLAKAETKKLSEDEKLLLNGIKARRQNQPTEPSFDPLMKKYPKDNYLHLLIMYNSDPKVAIQIGEAVVKRSPKFAPAYNLLGYLYMNQKDMTKAEENFNKYVSVRPDLANVYDSKGDFMMENKRFADAIPLYEKAASMGMSQSARKVSRAKARIKYPDLSDALKEEIRKQLVASFEAYEKSNVDGILGIYADQSMEIFPNQMVNVGMPNLKFRISGMFKDVAFAQEDFTPEGIDGVGAVAVAYGTEKTVIKDLKTGKEESPRAGNAMFIFRKQQDGSWKVIADHFYDQPESGNTFTDEDKKAVNEVLYKWANIAKKGDVLTEQHLNALEALYSRQAIEIFPGQRSNIGIANLRTRWGQFIGVKAEYSTLGTLGTAGLGRRAVAWGIGQQELFPSGSTEMIKSEFPWAMILTKEKDDNWRILAIHWYSE